LLSSRKRQAVFNAARRAKGFARKNQLCARTRVLRQLAV
jgi:hypothetical protein